MSISLKELLGPYNIADIDHASQINLEELLKKINIVRDAYGKPLTVTSGIRTIQDQLRIYRAKGIPDNKIPMGSQHLKCLAVDIADSDGELHKWAQANPDILEAADMYCEERQGNWQHFQCRPFGSYKPGGTRWFNP